MIQHLKKAKRLLTEEQVWWLVESRRWQAPFPRTYVAYSGPLPRDTVVAAALAYGGPDTAACDATAGAYWGLCRGRTTSTWWCRTRMTWRASPVCACTGPGR